MLHDFVGVAPPMLDGCCPVDDPPESMSPFIPEVFMSTTQDTIAAPQIFAPAKVQTGTVLYNYSVTPGWPMTSGTGHRPFSAKISFPQPFREPPTVTVALTGLDSDHRVNTRITIAAENVTKEGFTLSALTWADSIIYGVWGIWLALES
jgi:hypothetical protein